MECIKKTFNWAKSLIENNGIITAFALCAFTFVMGGVFIGENCPGLRFTTTAGTIESGITALVLTALLGVAIKKFFGGVWDTLKNSASKDDLESLRVSVNNDIKDVKESIAEHAKLNTAQYIKMIEAVAAIKK